MTCSHDVKRVAIDPSLLGEDKDMLEDLVAAAINDAVRRVEATTQEKMGGSHRRACRCRPASSCRSDAAIRRPRRWNVRWNCARCRWASRCRASTSSRGALRCLPGVGPKAAQRMALHLLQHDRDGAQRAGARARRRDPARPPLRALQHLHRGRGLRACAVRRGATRRCSASSRRRPTS